MFETSQDILYLVLAASVGVFTIFLVWLIAEIAVMLRRMNRFVRELQETVEKIEKAISGIREKFEHSAGYLQLVMDGVTQLVRFFITQKIGKPKSKK